MMKHIVAFYLRSNTQQPWRGRSCVIPSAILAVYVLCGFLYVPSFLKWDNLISIIFSCAITLPVAMGMQALLILGFFDLSVGAIASFIGMAFAFSLSAYGNFAFAAVVALFCALAIGVANGLFVTKLAI